MLARSGIAKSFAESMLRFQVTCMPRSNLPANGTANCARRLCAVLLFFSISILTTIVHAAEIRVFARSWVLLEGKNEKGDYDKIFKIAEFMPGLTEGIYLFSPGGDVAEAIRIGRLIRRLRWTTDAPLTQQLRPAPSWRMLTEHYGLKDPMQNGQCASACFFIYIAGIYRSGDTLLIHRPYLSETELRRISGDQVLKMSQVARTETDAYLKEMGLPAKYSELMYSVPKDQVQLLALSDIKADLDGFIPELKDWVDARCEKTTNVERVGKNRLLLKPAEKWTSEDKEFLELVSNKEVETIKCWKHFKLEMRTSAGCDVFAPGKAWCK